MLRSAAGLSTLKMFCSSFRCSHTDHLLALVFNATVSDRLPLNIGISMAHQSPKPSTLVEMAHAALKKNIIAGHHRPGEKLRVEHLKAEYGVSGGTLREALTMLIADKLVVSEGQRGFRVSAVSADDLMDLCQLRILLEREALKQAIEHGDAEWEAQVLSAAHVLSRATRDFVANPKDEEIFDDWERKHRHFHLVLIDAAPSNWLKSIIEMSYQQYERYRHMFLQMASELYTDRDAGAEHQAMVQAVIERDVAKAQAIIEKHLSLSIHEWIDYFERRGGDLDSPDTTH